VFEIIKRSFRAVTELQENGEKNFDILTPLGVTRELVDSVNPLLDEVDLLFRRCKETSTSLDQASLQDMRGSIKTRLIEIASMFFKNTG
jgi:hypothetical protein